MTWSDSYNQINIPTLENINDFIKNSLWNKLCSFIESTYNVSPKIEYSKCSMQKGWNVKYKKSGKSLCTLYPMDGYFIALIVIGEKELTEAEIIMPTCTQYVQELFSKTVFSVGGKWLMIEVNNKDVMEHIERIRGMAAERAGFVENWEDARKTSTSIPKVAIISKPQDYVDMDGNEVKAEQMDMSVRAISVGKLHKACPMTVAVAIGSASKIEGTIINDIVKPDKDQDIIAFGHASGVTKVDVKLDGEEVIKGGVTRTARRIMDGYVYVRD
jgi:hypothetical protein